MQSQKFMWEYTNWELLSVLFAKTNCFINDYKLKLV